jgi:hypothetical protein
MNQYHYTNYIHPQQFCADKRHTVNASLHLPTLTVTTTNPSTAAALVKSNPAAIITLNLLYVLESSKQGIIRL